MVIYLFTIQTAFSQKSIPYITLKHPDIYLAITLRSELLSTFSPQSEQQRESQFGKRCWRPLNSKMTLI